MKLGKKSIIAIVVAALVVVAAVVGIVIWKAQPKGAVAAVSTLPDSLNPVLEQNTSGMNASELIFDGLTNFEVDPQTNQLYTELALAENIEQDQKDRKLIQLHFVKMLYGTMKALLWLMMLFILTTLMFLKKIILQKEII